MAVDETTTLAAASSGPLEEKDGEKEEPKPIEWSPSRDPTEEDTAIATSLESLIKMHALTLRRVAPGQVSPLVFAVVKVKDGRDTMLIEKIEGITFQKHTIKGTTYCMRLEIGHPTPMGGDLPLHVICSIFVPDPGVDEELFSTRFCYYCPLTEYIVERHKTIYVLEKTRCIKDLKQCFD